jgi:HEAT repeat protein
MNKIILILGFLTLCLAGPAAAQTGIADRLKAYRFGPDRSALDTVAADVSASRTDPARRKEAARELASVLQSGASFDAKQFACRQLVLVAGEEQVPVLTALLQDDPLAHYALMVLSHIPGKSADEALLKALPTSKGRTRLEIIEASGARNIAAAIPALTEGLQSTDSDSAEAASNALTKMTDPLAMQALQNAYARSTGERQTILGHALLAAALHAQDRRDREAAEAVYEQIDRTSQHPSLRAAALRGLAQTRGEKALPLIFAALSEDGTLRQATAARLARDLRGTPATRRLAEYLPKVTGRAQILLLEALADRGDPAASPAISEIVRSAQGESKIAALRALGAVGDASVIDTLLAASSSGQPLEREAARTSLVGLRGDEIDRRLIARAESGAAPLQVEAIRALGERRAVGAVPLLVSKARSPEQTVSTAALRVLRDMGQSGDLPVLLDILLATPAGERDTVIETVSAVARRGDGEAQLTGVLIGRLPSVTKPQDRGDLLTILGQIGGPNALAVVRKAQEDANPEVKTTALRILSEWPTDEPMADLLKAVQSSPDATQRTLALRGYIQMIGMNEQRTPDQALTLYRDAAALARNAGERRLVLGGLATLKSLPALELASKFLTDNDVKEEAELAVVEIGRGTAGAYREKTRAALEPIAASSANENTKGRARDVLALIGKLGEFVTTWEVSPAYRREGVEYNRLFDMPFPPEEPGKEKEVAWRVMPAGTNPDQPWLLDLLGLLGGDQRVAYLRTTVVTEDPRDLILELGSDDGIKVWLNGNLVHANNTARAVAPGQEKVKVHLERGANTVLLKVTQNNQGWGAVARFTNPEGSAAQGLRFTLPSDVGVAR